MEEKNETRVEYNDRRKELTQNLSQAQEIKDGEKVIGSVEVERKAVFTENGIKKIYGDLRNQRTKQEQAIKQSKEGLKDAKELTPNQKKLEKNLQAINDFNASEKTKEQLKVQEKGLKETVKDMQEIKGAIGDRLKL